MAETPTDRRKGAPVLNIENLSVAYKVRGGEIEAVQDVSFDIYRGETHGIVGESGCGKSSLAKAILRLLPRNAGAFDGDFPDCRNYQRLWLIYSFDNYYL